MRSAIRDICTICTSSRATNSIRSAIVSRSASRGVISACFYSNDNKSNNDSTNGNDNTNSKDNNPQFPSGLPGGIPNIPGMPSIPGLGMPGLPLMPPSMYMSMQNQGLARQIMADPDEGDPELRDLMEKMTTVAHLKPTAEESAQTYIRDRDELARQVIREIKPAGENKIKRFWGKVEVVKNENGTWNAHLLKGISLKSTAGRRLDMPNEALARVVAAEWEAQGEYIRQSTMPVTALTSAAAEFTDSLYRDDIDNIKAILSMEPICTRAAEDEDIAAVEKKFWDPLLKWFEKEFGAKLKIFEYRSSSKDMKQDQSVISAVENYVRSMSLGQFVAFKSMVSTLDSVVVALALDKGHVTVEQAIFLANLEKEYQINRYGEVKGFHDMDRADYKTRLAAAVLFKALVPDIKITFS